MNARRATGLILSLALCAGYQNTADTKPAGEATDKEYDIKAKVVAIDPDRKNVTVDHEEIPGLMKAMQMKYAVADPKVLDGITVGDQVAGRLKARSGSYTITHLEKVAAAR
jgi:Cu/Ag efflux protein CusF